MSSIDRRLHADVLRFDLGEEERRATHAGTLERDGRSSRTLLKDGPLRLTLIVLAPGGGIPEHTAPGPITIQPLRGRVEVMVAGDTHSVAAGEVVSMGPGVPHAISTGEGAAFLLTVTHPPAE
ncbi:MAG TPA: cupin domain-containing protein [Longimicrobiales bacterium]|nr:cupin domain-containing protein [Longimicrobiales bacterium]